MKWNFCPSYVTFEQKLWIDLSLESLSQWVFSSEKKDECVFFPWKENCIGIRGDWHRYYKAVTVFDFIPKGRKSFIQTPRYWPKQADVSKKLLLLLVSLPSTDSLSSSLLLPFINVSWLSLIIVSQFLFLRFMNKLLLITF